MHHFDHPVVLIWMALGHPSFSLLRNCTMLCLNKDIELL
jgi:hypothetical protein